MRTLAIRLLAVYRKIELAEVQLSQIEQSLIDELRVDDLVDKLVRHRIARFMMLGDISQNFGIVAPIFCRRMKKTRDP